LTIDGLTEAHNVVCGFSRTVLAVAALLVVPPHSTGQTAVVPGFSRAATGQRAEPRSAHDVTELAWLAGCWSFTSGSRRVEEQWMAPGGGVMLGMSRTVAGGALREFEFLAIRQEGGVLAYVAQPGGRPPTIFPVLRMGPREAVFQNLGHDFPQRIIYRLREDDVLAARVEAGEGAAAKGIDFACRRAGCPVAGAISAPGRWERAAAGRS
jgi:hypothetical protein